MDWQNIKEEYNVSKNKHYSPQNLQFYKLLKDKFSINAYVSN